MINLDMRVKANKDIDATDLDGEKVMMNLELGKYFALNQVGSRIWEMVESEITVKDIVETLLNEYDVDKETCEHSVSKYLEVLEKEELIEIY